MTPWEELIVVIETKNSWGKLELLRQISLILAKHTKA